MPRYTGLPISLDLRDEELTSVFRLVADISQLNVVVHPGVAGKITFQSKSLPWDEALDRILPPNGYAWSHVGPVLEVALPDELRTSHRFAGSVTDVNYNEVELQEALRLLATQGGHDLKVEGSIPGTVTIRLERVPWDQALDVIARCNGLAWRLDGTSVRIWR
jgi:type II secretory pathway component HofQ